MDDTSLDDFLSGDDSEEATDGSGSDVGEQASETDDSVATDSESTDPEPSTSRWDSDGVSCADCGEMVQRVWDAADGLVCATCKEW